MKKHPMKRYMIPGEDFPLLQEIEAKFTELYDWADSLRESHSADPRYVAMTRTALEDGKTYLTKSITHRDDEEEQIA